MAAQDQPVAKPGNPQYNVPTSSGRVGAEHPGARSSAQDGYYARLPAARNDVFSMHAMNSALPDFQSFGNQPQQQRYQSAQSSSGMAYPLHNMQQYLTSGSPSNPAAQAFSNQLHTQSPQAMYGAGHPMAHQAAMMNAAQYHQDQNFLLQHVLQISHPAYYNQPAQHARNAMLGAGAAHFAQRSRNGHAGLGISTASTRGDSASNGGQASVVRGPPRKPKQSGHAIWIGNLPPQTDLMTLVHHVCKEAEGLESLFLISKSNCAFANFKDESACVAGQGKIHESRFQTVRLVSRLRRGGTEKGGNMTVRPSETPPEAPKPESGQDQAGGSAAEEPQPVLAAHESTATASDKYFIVKSLTIEDLELSVRNGVWATQSHNEEVLNQAYQKAENVYLIFSANKSGEYFGYARMTSAINDDPAAAVEFAPSVQAVEDPELPKATPTPATEFAPKGRIIDDSARGTIFWEADRDEMSAEGEATAKDSSDVAVPEDDAAEDVAPDQKTWGKPFTLEWMSVARLPFYRTRGLRNPWNSNREVKIARDGTELEPSVGRRLIELFHRDPSSGAGAHHMMGPQHHMAMPVQHHHGMGMGFGYDGMRGYQ